MKGIIFTEFMELVEQKFGPESLETILEQAKDQGVYTAVGSYDHKALVKLIVALSQLTNIPPEELQRVFGHSIFKNLYQSLPKSASLHECKNTFQFIRLVEDYIHLEVKKLYSDANPPKFEFISETETELVFDYVSARCMAHVCLGLVEGCAEYFDQSVEIFMDKQTDVGNQVRFSLQLVDA